VAGRCLVIHHGGFGGGGGGRRRIEAEAGKAPLLQLELGKVRALLRALGPEGRAAVHRGVVRQVAPLPLLEEEAAAWLAG
jgi:hypothetical protein